MFKRDFIKKLDIDSMYQLCGDLADLAQGAWNVADVSAATGLHAQAQRQRDLGDYYDRLSVIVETYLKRRKQERLDAVAALFVQ